MNQLVKKTEAPVDVIAHDVEPLTVHTDAGKYTRMGWIIAGIGLGGFLLWASLAPLDKGVPLSGTVTKEGNRKTLQHQGGGIIQDILVKDGDVVKAGQVLVRMSNVQANSNLETSLAQYFTARSAEARLTAERDGAAKIAFPPALERYKSDPRVAANMELQSQLMSARRLSLQNELAATDESIAGLKLQMNGLDESRKAKKEQLTLLKEQLEGMRDLSKDGYVARNRLLELERTYAQINGAVSEDIGNIGRYRQQVLELTLRRAQRQQDYQKEVRSQLADNQREAAALQGRLEGQEFDVANTEVKAPVDGVVVGSTVFTKGGVIGAGQKMMDIVPTDDPLVVEGELAVNLVDKVHPGLPVELIFSAFNANKTPHIPGELIQISADRSVNEHSGVPFYKVRARVTKEGAKLIADHKLHIQSGMPVEMFVKTGERTMMSYLFKPMVDRAHSALSEE